MLDKKIMIRSTYTILIILLISATQSCSPFKDNYNLLKLNNKENIYHDKNVITNKDWRELIFYVLNNQKDTPTADRLGVDSVYWKASYPMKTYTKQQTNSFPITGITVEQALLYCKLRTDAINTHRRQKMQEKETISFKILTKATHQEIDSRRKDYDQTNLGELVVESGNYYLYSKGEYKPMDTKKEFTFRCETTRM